MPFEPHDKYGRIVRVGARVRLIGITGRWLDDLPTDEKPDVLSMVGDVVQIEEIDEYGSPWIRKSWPNEAEGTCRSHSIAFEPEEMELVDDNAL